MSKNDPIILPEKYYLDYFNYVLEFVERQYDHILDKPEYLFYQEFRDLSEQAQCLYLRFSNRQGNYFRINKIAYAEIPDVHDAKEELLYQGFIQVNESNDPDQFRLFTRQELISLYEFLHPTQKKSEILLELTETDIPIIHEKEEVAEVLKNEEVDFIKMLFFGHRGGRMTDFVIRDVGNVKIEKLDETKFSPWFESREEALAVMHLSQLKKMIYEIQEADLPLEDYLEEMPWNTWLSYPRSAKTAEKLLLKIAYYFEQIMKPDLALSYYSYTDRPPARERKVRLLDRLDQKEEAMQMAKQMLENPANASELTFATDFLNRKGIRIDRSMTKRLKDAPSIEIPRPESTVEKAVLTYFEEKGWDGLHAENFLWRGLFGLTFWNVIFDESHGSFHHPLQRQPSDLNDSIFFESREPLLTNQLNRFRTRKQLIQHIDTLHEEKNGIANRFVTWHESLLPSLEVMIQKLPLKSLKKVLLEMSKNMKENSAGFPDLFLWNEDDYQFYEVKSPNDQLSAQQLFWLDFMASAKIKVDVLRVNYLD
ncbi:VRR-NUC domain-containing protein [Ekhidna sp. MALMAid0563]|uniref:VRR-NUC domain-containing protein n=1 Tax=Ekhidna sp. MALMAid0563 TaxID=3143937 RepID=UPI0032E0300B